METVTELRERTTALHEYFIRATTKLREESDTLRVTIDTDLAVARIFVEEKQSSGNSAMRRAADRLIAVHQVLANATYLVEALSSSAVPDDGRLVDMASGTNLLRLSYNLDTMMRMANLFIDDILEMDFDNPEGNGNGS